MVISFLFYSNSLKPNSFKYFSLSLHFFITLTNNSKYTFFPNNSSKSLRASIPTSLIKFPPLPITIFLTESRSTITTTFIIYLSFLVSICSTIQVSECGISSLVLLNIFSLTISLIRNSVDLLV